ncbi:MAG: shikimate dehydrogenase [Deltaproteobacteria bacterium]|nr:shikimate dehydrogenase [Deltaproteobacteria bacterium]
MEIQGSTRIVGLFGFPVRHTFSPPMHNAAFAERGLDYVYLPFEVHPENLPAAVKALVPLGIAGVNVTIPHKETVIPLLDEISGTAERIGSVNTIRVREGKLKGFNTDAYGFETALFKDGGVSLSGKKIFVMGAGGAARAVCFQSALSGAEELVIADVLAERAEALASAVAEAVPVCRISTCSVEMETIEKAVAGKDLFVNATPVGMKETDPPLIRVEWLEPSTTVFDVIYNPLETRLLREAKDRGLTVVNGIGMLVHQGALAFEIFTGRKPPVETMLQVLKERFES